MEDDASILIVGAGGLGVPAANALARGGIRRITILDPDPVELSNLARQVIYREGDIGKSKAESLARHLREHFPKVQIEAHAIALDTSNAPSFVRSHKFIIDATDNPAAKFLIDDVALREHRAFVYGGVLGMAGQAMTIIPGETSCLRCLFEDAPDEAEIASCREAGIIGPVAGVIGEVQAAEAIAFTSGRRPALAGKILTYDAAQTGRMRTAEVTARTGCVCGVRSGKLAPLHQ